MAEAIRPFAGVKQGGGAAHFPSNSRSPIVYLKALLAALEPDFEGVLWEEGGHPSRLFAFVGLYDTSYAFRAGSSVRRFLTSSQSAEVNRRIMDINQKVMAALKELQKSPAYAMDLSPLVPPPHNVATLHKTVKAVEGRALGIHSDDEPHGSPLITSVSFGAEALFVMYPFGTNTQPVEVVLGHGDVVFFDRQIPHGVFDVKGERVNITFRTWPDAPWWRPDVGLKRVAEMSSKASKKARTSDKRGRQEVDDGHPSKRAIAPVTNAEVRLEGPYQPLPPSQMEKQQKPAFRNWERPQKVPPQQMPASRHWEGSRGAPRRFPHW